jgi:hypothetical protein
MPTTLSFKDKIDKPDWRPLSITPIANAAGMQLVCDLRNDASRDPWLWGFAATTYLLKYLTPNDDWIQTQAFSAVGGAIAAGSFAIFCPSHGPTGVVGGTPTTTSFTLAALPNSAQVGENALADNGSGVGYRIRVIGSGSGGSGKVEERTIIANTAGATPVVTLNAPLTFTPLTTDRYELLSGRVYLLGSGTTAAGFFRAFDVATGTLSGNLSITNLGATIAIDTGGVMLDELYVPHNRLPGQGFFGVLTATAMAAGTLTGHSSGGDAGVLANEYRNFQIRIVEDTTTPTAVGQRRKIASHTAGASPVYTLASNWTVTPSATAKYVIELNNDLLLWTNNFVVTYSYAAGGFAADASWATAAASGGATQYANPPAAHGAGVCAESLFSIVPDAAKNARHSFIYRIRGGGSAVFERFNIAGGANGVWSTLTWYGNQLGQNMTTGTWSAHDPIGSQGKYFYVCVNGTQRIIRFNMLTCQFEPWAYIRFAQGAATVGCKGATAAFLDNGVVVPILYLWRSTGQEVFDCILQR